MDFLRTWVARATAVLTGLVLAVVVPATAWASSNGVYDLADDLVRRRARFGLGGASALCCLVVVAVITLLVVLLLQSRRRRRR